MSQDNNPTAVRAIALSEAVKASAIDEDCENILFRAQAYLDFLNAPATASVAEPKPAKSVKPAKPAAPAKSEPTAEEILIDRKAKIGAKVQEALAANLRDGAVAVMKQFGGASVSSVAAGTGDLAAILSAFDDLLASA